jgi:exodeoxyribonuclease VII small subunit
MAIRKKKNDTQFENLSFEEAIENLTEIVNQIETEQVPLAESLEKYEKGMSIIRHCRQILLDAEKRIEEIGDDKPVCPPEEEGSDEEQTGEEDEKASDAPGEPEEEEDSLF